jgi:carboxypeptidase C (cathepsin A)
MPVIPFSWEMQRIKGTVETGADVLQKNIDFKFYDSGHMVYAHEASLKSLHSSVAAFILATQN